MSVCGGNIDKTVAVTVIGVNVKNGLSSGGNSSNEYINTNGQLFYPFEGLKTIRYLMNKIFPFYFRH